MPFQCCQMGLVKLIGDIYQLLFDQREQTKDMTRFLHIQAQHTQEVASLLQAQGKHWEKVASLQQAQAKHIEEVASCLKDIQQAQTDQKWFYETIGTQIQNIELRTSKRMCSPVDAIRHISQEARGEIWGLNLECFQVAAQMFETQGIFTRGQLPVFADITRGQFHAAEQVLARHQPLAEKEEWQPGVVAFAMPGIQNKVIQASENALTRQRIDEVLGINPEIRVELNEAIAEAQPRYKLGDQDPVSPQDPEYARQLHQMLPAHVVSTLFPDNSQRT